MIRDDSPLVCIPTSVGTGQSRYLDAIRLTLSAIGIGYDRLASTLLALPSDGPASPFQVGAVMQDAWSIVDGTHRLRALVNQLQGYKKNAPSKQIFLRATVGAEELRNSVQHIVSDLPMLIKEQLPALGALTWLCGSPDKPDEVSIGVLIPGQFGEVDPRALVELPSEVTPGISRVTLLAAGKRLDLTAQRDAAARLAASLEDMIDKQTAGTEHRMADSITHIKLQLLPAEADHHAVPSPAI